MSTAFNIFLRQVVLQNGLPFEVTLNMPNEITIKAMEEIENVKSGKQPKKTQSISDFINEMGE